MDHTYTFNSIPFLLCDGNGLCAWRQSSLVIIKVFAQQLQKLFGVLSDDLRNLWVAGRNLLKDGLEHVGLLLDELSKLLEMGVAAEEVQVCEGLTAASTSGTSRASTTAYAFTSLGGSFEQVHRLVATRCSLGSGGNGRRSIGSALLMLLLLLLLLLLLNIVGNAL